MIDDQKCDLIVWQEDSEDHVAEKPVALRKYGDGLIEIRQHGNEVLLRAECVVEFVRAIKMLAAREEK